GDAGQLLTVTDVDPHRADVDAGHAIDAIAVAALGLALALLAARLAPPFAVADGDRVLVHHRRLDARPRAAVDADLFADEAAAEDGRGGQEGAAAVAHGMRVEGHEVAQQRRRTGEIEHPGAARGQADQQPEKPFGAVFADLLGAPGLAVEPEAGV